MRRWLDLSSEDVEIELAERGTTLDDLVYDVRDDHEAAELVERLTSQGAKERFALKWFGDQRHRQPPREKRSEWLYKGYTPEFGQLSRLEDDGTPEAAHSEPNRTQLPPLPSDVNLFLFASIQKAVRLFDERDSQNEVVDKTIFTPHDAARIRWLWQREYLSLNTSGILLLDWRVGRAGKRYALRVWDERAESWLDPTKP